MLIIILGFLLAAIAVIVAIAKAIRNRASYLIRNIYLGFNILAGVVTFYTTFFYSFFRNSNTEIYGWPVPIVIFQRTDKDSPWLDFVGPGLFSYPMNFILFSILPSLMFLIWIHFKPSEAQPIKPKQNA